MVERILRERPAGWFGNYNELLLRCFADGMEEGQRMQGADPSRWKWGRNMFLTSAIRLSAGCRWWGNISISGLCP